MSIPKVLLAALGAAVLAGACALPAQAQTTAPPNPNSVRFSVGYFASTSDINLQSNTDNPQGSLITNNNSWKNGWGIGASIEHKFTPMMGLDVGAKYFRPRIDLAYIGRDDRVSFVPVTASLLFHFGSPDSVDFHFGPSAAYIWYGKFRVPLLSVGGVTGETDLNFKNELTWGGTAGIDFAITPTSAISIAADYIAADAKVDRDPNAAFFGIPEDYKTRPRPVLLTAGFTMRF